ncbi:MAG: efflux RND transporter periplasmic adaptor subunit [bacterium]|nr:efflux RND transporter periplasmic adaptor subunit [bacterium]
MRRIIVIVLVLAVAAVGFWKFRDSRAAEPTSYRLVEITKGNLASVVAATGNLQPVTTVQVGTQVSGIVEQVLVDFNSHVTAGQVIARIDKTLLISAVSSSRAQLERIEAEQRHAEAEYQRLSELHDQKMISDSEFNTAQYNRDAARASVKSAKVDLERAERNLGYATITSPIDGIVVQRSIDPGQTVQASFSAPQLFQIAGDLAAMQILVSVDESDIGQIKVGLPVKFTVQAYPDDSFSGTVRQVRLQSVTQENVVTYIAVVDVPNADQRLLPGMTASVEFIVDQVQDVLQVANAALRYRPDQETMTAIIERKRASMQAQGGPGGAPGDTSRTRAGGRPAGRRRAARRRAAWAECPAALPTALPAACPPTAARSGSPTRTASSTSCSSAPASPTAPTPRSADARLPRASRSSPASPPQPPRPPPRRARPSSSNASPAPRGRAASRGRRGRPDQPGR